MMRIVLVLAALAPLAGCAPPPEVEAALGPEPAGTAYPALVPLSDVLALDLGDAEANAEADAELAARAAALRARAAALGSGSGN